MYIKKIHGCTLLLAVAFNSSAETTSTSQVLELEKHKLAQIPNLFFMVPNLPISLIAYYLPEMIKKSHANKGNLCAYLSNPHDLTNWPINFCAKPTAYKSYGASRSSKHFQIPKLTHSSKQFQVAKIPEMPKAAQVSNSLVTPKPSPLSKFTRIFKSFHIPKFCHLPKSIHMPKSFHIPKLFHIPKSYIPKISIQGGALFASQGRVQHINIYDLIGDDFSVSNQKNVNGLFGLGLYWTGLKTRYADFSYGLNAYYMPNTVTEGFVTRENLYTNLSYSYSLTNWPIYFAGKMVSHKNIFKNSNIILDGGIGFNIINANNFQQVPLVQNTVADAIFLNNTQVSFSATAGIGLRMNDFFGRTPLDCGYRFFYLGQGSFSKATDQVLDSLKTGNSYANAFVCSITL